MRLTTPRLVLAGVAGDSGKTLVTLGLAGAFASRGLAVAPFKKGPDYIDAAWLGVATGKPGRNLDTFLMDAEAIGETLSRGEPADVMLVEGNRGLHDGLDAVGSHSTAELAKLLDAPVILVVDVTKMTRTAAALVLGCATVDPSVRVAGVVLNRVATPRQESVIRDAILSVSGHCVLGAIPRLKGNPLPGRHLGLVTAAETPAREAGLSRVTEAVAPHVDLEAILDVARSAPPVEFPDRKPLGPGPRVRIGVLRDEALSFYYPENLEALEEAGAELLFVSPLADGELPALDALYLGGGFPEVYAERLADNHGLREAVRIAAENGLPIYAECGGLMYLARELIVGTSTYPMAGVLDLIVEHTLRPTGHGYVVSEVDRPNPFFAVGTCLRGHEFHYSHLVAGEARAAAVLRLQRGHGLGGGRDGLVVGRVWASYTHLHALGTPCWAEGFAGMALTYRHERFRKSTACA